MISTLRTRWTVSYYNFGLDERYYLQTLDGQWTTTKGKALTFPSETDAEIAKNIVLRVNAPLFPVKLKKWSAEG